MAAVAQQLVGRIAETDALDQALSELGRRRPAVIAVAGEPGIGKTRMLAELAARAEAHGWIVVAGSASEFEHDMPFWVFVDALDEYLAARESGRLTVLDTDSLAELAHVFPALEDSAAPTASALQLERYRTHRAVRQLLQALAASKPLVLLLDDVHWADPGSIELLGSLLRRPPTAPVLIAIAFRPRQLPERLSAALERARRIGTLAWIEVGPLSEEEARELLGPDLSRSAAATLYEESSGNPFYLELLSRSRQRRMRSSPSPTSPADVVAATLAEERALLSVDACRVLDGAAVVGDPFEPELVSAAADCSEAAVTEALDELLRVDLVRPTEVPRRFRFRHPLVRQAIYEGSPGGWRIAAHERTAEALAERGAPVIARAHHVEQAARHGDESAIAVLREAAVASAQRAPDSAARWFRAALRLLGPGAPVEQQIPLLRPLAGALAATGAFEDARSALLQVLALVPVDAVTQRIEIAGECARVEGLLGRHLDARARLEATLDGLDDRTSAHAAGLLVSLAGVAFFRADFDDLRSSASQALALAEPLGERPLTAAATALLAAAAAFDGTAEEADRRCSEAAALIDAMPDAELATRLDAISHLGVAELYNERFSEAAVHAERGLAVARTTGQGELVAIMIPTLATCFLLLGRLADAIVLLDGAIEGARLTGNAQALALFSYNRSLVALLQGDLDAALGDAEEAVELASELDAGLVSAWAGAILGFALIERGDASAGVETILRFAGGQELTNIGAGWRPFCFDRLVSGWLALARRDEAERDAEAAKAVAAAIRHKHPAAMARRAAARVALAGGDASAAAEEALGSAALADELGARLEAALSRTLAGQALAASGAGERAATELERAVTCFEDCGALRYRAAAELELGRLGRRRHRRSRPGTGSDGLGSLSARELEVARLIVDRHTNAEIAAELYLSPKTVETHVRNLFHKLGVNSRVEVARVVERADRADD